MKLRLISKSCFSIRLIAILLVVVTVVTLIPKNLTVHAFESESQPDLAGTITAEDTEQYSIVSRDQASETDLNSLIFNTKNGEKAEFFYPYDVKYIDSEGLVHDKDTTISKAESGFASSGTGINISFSDKITDGVSVTSSDNKYFVIFAPLDSADSYSDGFLTGDNSTVRYTGSKSSFEYGATFAGIKENIVLDEYSGVNSWSFRLLTNGLALEKKGGQYVLSDGDETVMFFGSILAFTADDRNNTFGELIAETVTEAEEYVLTISVSDEWLKSGDTSYPVTIDPSITVNYATGSSAIQDEILSSTNTYSVTYDVLYIGKGDNNEKLRGVICFPNLNLTGKEITSASLEIRDVMCESTPTLVEMYEYTGNAWNENTTLTWSNAASYGEFLDSRYVKFGGGNAGSDIQRYSFDITSLAQKWAAGFLSPSQGVLIKTTDAFENDTGSFHRCFASKDYGTDSLKPSLIITYVSPKGYNPSYTFDSRTLDSNITVYNYHNHGNILATYSFDVKNAKGFPLPLFYAYNSTDDSWRLSIEETIISDAGRYRYTDGYGTEYYFSFKSSGKYENEALGLEITVSSSEIVLETDDGIRKSFDPSTGRISALEYDKDTYSYTYGSSGISSISKNNDALFSFEYNSIPKLSSAFGYTFGYTDGRLTSITDKYGNSMIISRTYYAIILLTSIDFKSSLTTNGIHVTLDSNTRKATSVVTYRGNTSKNITDDLYTYGTGWTAVSSNLADVDPDDPQNTTVTYIFDENGKTVNEIRTASGKCISAYDHRTDDLEPGNLVGGGEANLFGNTCSFESSCWTNGTSVASADALFGSKVMSVAASGYAFTYIYPAVGRYCLSMYVKGENAKARMAVSGINGDISSTTEVYPLYDSWVRLHIVFDVPSAQSVMLAILNTGSGTMYCDCAQLEKSEAPTTFNSLLNASFDSNLSDWTGGTISQNTIFGTTCKIDPGSSINQSIAIGSVSEDTPFTISGWIYKPNRLTDAEIRLTFHGTTSRYASVHFDGFASGIAMFSCAQILPPEGAGNITSITFSVVNNSSSGYVYVDNLLLSFGSITRSDDTDHSSQGLEFESYNNGTCMVSGIGTCNDRSIVIPDRSPAGDTVIHIGTESFKQNTNIESVTIPDTVTRIYHRAFKECTNLKTVNIGSSVTRIDDAVFYQCNSLEEVNIPDTVTYIDSSAFDYCASLKTLILSENLNNLGSYVFSNCSSLKKVTVPASLTSLPAYTFAGDTAGLTVYYTGSSSQWSSMTKGTGALPSGYTLVCDAEIKNGSVYEYTYSGGYKSSVKVTSLDIGSQVESYTYDANGNITGYVDSVGNESSFVYDSSNNLTTVTAPGGRTTLYFYNNKGDVVSETDPDGNVTTYTYSDTTGLLTSQTKGGTTVTYSYSNGLVSSVVVSGTNYSMPYSYLYNDYGNIISVRSGSLLQTVSSYTYTCGGRGKLKSKTESNGYYETYSYDNTGNLVSTSVSGYEVYENTYDFAGNCLRSTDAYLGTADISLITPDGGSFTYTFDISGTIVKTVTESGRILFANGSEYNELPEDISIDSETDALGRETEYALKLTQNNSESNVLDITRTYLDATAGASPNEVATESFSGAESFHYFYDGNGNLTEVRDGQNNIFLKYTYDAKGQLIREDNSYSDETYTFVYDANGNISYKITYTFTLTQNYGTMKSFSMNSYDSMNRDKITSLGGTGISYDGLNPTNWRNASNLTWRGRQLISRTQNDVTTTYEYNADGLRTKRTTGTNVTEYIWDGDRLIKEITPNYTITYLYHGYELIGFNVIGNNYYYAKDSFGVIRHIYTENGDLYCTYNYDAWGNMTSRIFADPRNTLAGYLNPIRYKSYYYDSDTGFYYLQSRYYDPVVGRFLNADDTAFLSVSESVVGKNLFSYCENNPTNNTDSQGQISITGIVCGTISGIAGWTFGDFLARNLGFSPNGKGLKGLINAATYWTIRSVIATGGVLVGWSEGTVLKILGLYIKANPIIIVPLFKTIGARILKNCIIYEVIKKAAYSAGCLVLEFLKLPISRETYHYAFYGFCIKWSSSKLNNKIKGNSTFINEIRKIVDNENKNIIESATIVIDEGWGDLDLDYSVGTLSLQVTGYKQGEKWYLHVYARDNYDFTEWRLLDKGWTFGNAANDLGHILSILGMMHTYTIIVDFDFTY